ncbi:MAG: CRISPR-associated helicase Cas3' [Paeniclostridium sordellii]|uniref:CRISPR-associated helicase Cas3 n=1 Tax=Paeniclostridium hominis TaxID=2764329 RepID=A0ABR7K3E8_9FIRM|nr:MULTISPECIES: CRISPR-associated helicase Cas3' [Paeniclostridium]MBC6003624.1 CRISPR-associated helicase Cas3' [Paeniclostridium hominis]MDU2592512.1 CRISPR-associated helicase Cas3' [Paeniclostridium sordellii]
MENFLRILFGVERVKLTEVQEKINKCNINKNQLILSSCGSGKTEASYYMVKKWNKKVLYAYPMKTLASSIHNRLNKYEQILNSGKVWTIQHSSANEDKFLSGDMCITTIDQVLSGYLAIGTQSFIKGKNVVISNFIFDEIQLFEPGKTLKTTICMLDKLKDNGNKFVIMTATMPKKLIDFLADRYDMQVTITDKPSVDNREVKLYYQEDLNIKKIEDFDTKQIIICNSQKEQEEIYNNINNKDRVILLNNKLLKEDRENIEMLVFKYFGKESEENDKILITTQIVEAGMDISATRMYSSLSPIDSLIQREGRVCRWGGNGELIVFNGFYDIYDKQVCENTLKKIESNQGLIFNWGTQKKWVNDILNPFYEEHLKDLKRFSKFTMKSGNRNDLIRDIENINIIVSKFYNKEDFEKCSISISRNTLKKLSTNNTFYKIKGKEVVEISERDIDNGDTIIIEGNDCIYDKVGFRFKEGFVANEFPCENKEKIKIKFGDYIKEPWIYHALATKEIMRYKLINSNFKTWTNEEIERYSTLGALHDLGKLNKDWQKFIGMDDKPLAHNVFAKRNSSLIKDARHNLISALAIDGLINKKLEFNLIINHHGRIMPTKTIENTRYYDMVDGYDELVAKVGYEGLVIKSQRNIDILDKHLMTPSDKDWVDFIYLEGILMESDIEAIDKVREYELNK